MTGIVSQLIALTSFGNEYLQTGMEPSDFYPENSTFQFCNSVKYVIFKNTIFSHKVKEERIADDPVKWFAVLKKEGCKKLSLNFENSKDQTKALNHQLAGMVGGGGSWFIEAVYNERSDFWINNWTVTNKEALDRKIWGVKYGLVSRRQPTIDLQYDVHTTRDELNGILRTIADFAFENNLDNWGEVFEKAAGNLNNLSPETNFYHKDLVVAKNYSLIARQLLFSAGLAWVFGGMGSWNDMMFDDADKERSYNELSAQLYKVIGKSIIAVCNSEKEKS